MKANFKRISIVSIITFVGIFLMQAFWILDSYRERRAHFSEHIQYVLDQVNKEYCIAAQNTTAKFTIHQKQLLIDSLFIEKLKQSGELPEYYLELQSDGETLSEGARFGKSEITPKEILFTKIISCPKSGNLKLSLHIEDNKLYFAGSIIGWIILSSLLIIVGIIAVFINISFLRKQKKTSQIKSDFIGNMTHELKTPIATISVASEMLMKDRVLDDRVKSKRYSTIIFEENQRLKKLVERVMQIALFENGTMRLKLKETDLHKSINQSVEAIKMIIEKRQGNIELDLNAQDFSYQVDPTHFSNIITNLLENAIKYSPNGPIISITTTDYSEGILISIADQGMGIAKKHQERIFDRFYRVETGDVQNTQGFGLGLYYVRRVVEAHGGFIKVHSQEGNGSRFEIYLPKL
jgi:two-component system phosphate regulon sensor histidine kinase PhoR